MYIFRVYITLEYCEINIEHNAIHVAEEEILIII